MTPITLTRPLVSLDVESTGTDPQSDAITFFGGIKVFPDGERQECSTLVKPWREIPKEVEELTGITNLTVANERPFQDVAGRIFDFISGCDLASYNARGFDLQILYEEFHRCRLELVLEGINIIDPGVIYQRKDPRDLTAAVKKYCGREMAGAHTASLADTREVLNVLEGQRAAYADIGAMDIKALSEFSATYKDGSRRLDLAGTVIIDKHGVPRYTHKKVRGMAVADDTGYAEWMLSRDFPIETQRVLRKLLEQIYAHDEQPSLGF